VFGGSSERTLRDAYWYAGKVFVRTNNKCAQHFEIMGKSTAGRSDI